MMRVWLVLGLAFLALASASAATIPETTPAPTITYSPATPTTIPPYSSPILPAGTSAGDRDLIMMMFSERDRQYERMFSERDRQYDQRFHAQEIAVAAALQAAKEAVAAALTAAKEAVDKAEIANKEHFNSVNEFRKTLTDQTATFPPRTEVEIRFHAVEDKLRGIDDKLSALLVRESQGAGQKEGSANLWTTIIAGLAVLIAFGTLIMIVQRAKPHQA